MNFRRNTTRATTSNAIATGLPQSGETNRTQVTIVRNIFVNNDHAILLKEDAFGTIENNVFVGSLEAAIQFNEIGGTAVNGPGLGAYLDGNIFQGNAQLFQNLVDDGTFRTQLTANRNLMPNDVVDFDGTPINAHSLGIDNLAGNPRFVDAANGNYRLAPTSPAIGTGPNGIDMGAYVPAGPSISGVPTSPSSSNDQTLRVAGPAITHYRYRLNGGSYSNVRPVSEPIQLNNLANGDYTLDVLGMNDAGEWFAGQTPAYRENRAEIISPSRSRTGEALPIVVRVRDSHGNVNSLLSTPATLANASNLANVNFDVKKGVGSLSPTVSATADFALAMQGDLSASPTRNIDVLDATFPTQNYSGTISGNIVWDANTERRITGNVTVPAGSTLTIEAGTRVMFAGLMNLRVEGTLIINGTAAEPVVFNAINPAAPWGGLELVNGTGTIHYTFFTNGGADTSRNFGHSNSQPMIFVDGSQLNIDNSFVINNTGKAFASRRNAVINMDRMVISDVDTGAQFDNSIVRVNQSILKNIPNGDGIFVDDDNDGFYFNGVHSSGEPSVFQDSFVVTTKDDGLDHNGARLRVIRAWIEGVAHEGIASSNQNWVEVEDSVFIGNNQGVEAGYQMPDLRVSHSVIFDNNNKADAASPITAGIRFGDGYNGSNGAYLGHITAINNVVHDNFDNVRNFDGSIPGPKEGAIDITYSMTNDPDYNSATGNFVGVPVFGPFMHLLRGSAGLRAGSDGENVGRSLPAVSRTFSINSAERNLRIDEILSVGAGTDRIELFNGGGAPVSLAGLYITNNPAEDDKFAFPAGTSIAPGERLVLFADTQSVAGEIHVGFELDELGDEVQIYDLNGPSPVLVDSVEFGRQLAGHTIARGADGAWRLAEPTLGAANQTSPTALPNGTKINEWLAVGNVTFPDDFIELFNPRSLPVDVGGMYLSNNPASQVTMFTIAPLTFIDGQGLLVFTADNSPAEGKDHVNFELAANAGSIQLSATDQSLVDRVNYGTQTAGVSQGRRPNGGTFIDFLPAPTPGTSNPGDPNGPNAPTNLVATLVNTSRVDLTWTAVVDPDSPVAYYRVYRDGVALGTSTQPSFSDTTVTVGSTYSYQVAAVDTVDVEGARSASVNISVLNIARFQQGVFPTSSYAGSDDVWIRGSNPTTNYGADERMDADSQSNNSAEWSLIKWNISSLATTETVESATVTITVNDASAQDYGLYAVTRNWVESQANWNQYANGANWQSPGTGATDRGPLVGTLVARNPGTYDVQLNAAGISLVQSWIADPARNFGLIVYSATATDGLEMRTSEYGTATERPKLTIGLVARDTTGPSVLANEARLDQVNQQVRFQFNEDVLIGTGDLRLRNVTQGAFINSTNFAFNFDSATNTAVWTFPGFARGVLPDGQYEASLLTEEIVDLADNGLANLNNTSFNFAWFRGDMNANGTVEPIDIDALCAAQSPANSNPRRDIDGDGDVDRTDVVVLVRDVLRTRPGDADLDRDVDTTDLNAITSHMFQSGAGWGGGDFDCNGSTDGSDFNLWNENKFFVAAPAAGASSGRAPRAAAVATTIIPVSSTTMSVRRVEPATVSRRDSYFGHAYAARSTRRAIANSDLRATQPAPVLDEVLASLYR